MRLEKQKQYLYSLAIKTKSLLLIHQKLLNIFTLIPLQLNHLAHLRVIDNVAIAGKLLLDHAQNLLLVELLWKALDGG